MSRGTFFRAINITTMLLNSSRRLRVCAVRLGLALCLIGVPMVSRAATVASASAAGLAASDWTGVSLGGIDPNVFALALESAASAVQRGAAAAPSTLTVIDYSKPSTEPRMWVYDLQSRTLLFHELVSHGRGSGKTMATAFSNDAESNM